MALQTADARHRFARLKHHGLVLAQPTAAEGSGDDRPDAMQREDAVDGEARFAGLARGRQGG
jgi:hypothetical protein